MLLHSTVGRFYLLLRLCAVAPSGDFTFYFHTAPLSHCELLPITQRLLHSPVGRFYLLLRHCIGPLWEGSFYLLLRCWAVLLSGAFSYTLVRILLLVTYMLHCSFVWILLVVTLMLRCFTSYIHNLAVPLSGSCFQWVAVSCFSFIRIFLFV